MRSFVKNPFIILLLIIIVSFLIVYFIAITPNQSERHIIDISFLIYAATAALAIVAYNEFHRANQLNTNELLTFISNRWSSAEIIKARQIIHEIFVHKYRFDKKCNNNNDFQMAISATAVEILEMSKKREKAGKILFIY